MSQLALFAPEVLAAPLTPHAAPAGPHNQYARTEALMACTVIEAELMEIVCAAG